MTRVTGAPITVQAEDLQCFRASLARVRATAGFLPRFYARFLAQSPETARLFAGRDMERIQSKLKMTLEMVDDNAGDQAGLGMYLELLGRIHAGLHINSDQFSAWRDAALATVAEYDPEFDAAIRSAWKGVLDDLIAKLGVCRPGS